MSVVARFALSLIALFAACGAAIAQSPVAQTVTAGPYAVTLNQTTVDAKGVGVVTLAVRKDGKLATDLLPYGGSSGRADIVDVRTGAAIHTTLDPIGTSVSTQVPTKRIVPGNAGAEMEISLPPLAAGTYALRVYICGAGREVYSAAFVLVAR